MQWNKLLLDAHAKCKTMIRNLKSWLLNDREADADRMKDDWRKVNEWNKETEEDAPEEEGISSMEEPDLDAVQETAEKIYKKLQKEKNRRQAEDQKEMRKRMADAGRAFYRYVKGDYKAPMQAIWDPENGTSTTYLPRIHELFEQA